MSEAVIKTICLFARPAGLSCLDYLLLNKQQFQIKALVTHRYLPRSEASQPTERKEYVLYKNLAEKHSVPLYEINSLSDRGLLQKICKDTSLDLLISCSWRYKVESEVLDAIRYGGINLHRGSLPTYKGAEPIKRAIIDGCNEGQISAHQMTDEIDGGEVLATQNYKLIELEKEALEKMVERIKNEILPLYPIALRQAVNQRMGIAI